ncbi:MAG: hypothetical protein JNK65_05315, partial [Deltaproteobacteria bacterium]|nr:hypothetical protein [Deltaproteobacteria bacterium]
MKKPISILSLTLLLLNPSAAFSKKKESFDFKSQNPHQKILLAGQKMLAGKYDEATKLLQDL